MDPDNPPDQPTPMKPGPESCRLLEAFHAATRDDEYLAEVAENAKMLTFRFDSRHRYLKPPLSPVLQSLIQRTEDLEQAWEDFKVEHARTLDDAAWRFVTHAFGLHRGDRILCVCDQRPMRIQIGRLLLRLPAPVELAAEGPVLRKDGTPGKRHHMILLMETPWRKLPP